ncbi:MAG TPA: trypsin-like peptidase domain-containing protein [Gammaproteobacteria bacterium]|nr:trypsin-like peptidase domain-containing protein [Gammaproteobacteria bacterium]
MADGIRRLAGLVLVPLVLAATLTGCSDQPSDSDSQSQSRQPAKVEGASADGGAFSPIVAAHGPAVVNISTTRKIATGGGDIPDQLKGTPLEPFFKRFLGGQPDRERKVHTLGSGFIISSDGYVVTNAHVVAKASRIVVRLTDRRQLTAKLVGKDKVTDLALLKVDAEDLPSLSFADSHELEVGEWVVAVGAPFGFANSVTAGIVSAKGRSLPGDPGSYVPFLQTDVAINPGNSGGPLFDLDGKVVGVNSQIYSKSGGYMGLSFAIPSSVAKDVVAQLKAHGEVRHGWLGVAIQDIGRDLAKSLGMDQPRGGIVTLVEDGSPAADAGLETGDVIVAVDGSPVAKASGIPPLVGGKKPGTTLRLTLLRDGDEIQRKVRLGALSDRE